MLRVRVFPHPTTGRWGVGGTHAFQDSGSKHEPGIRTRRDPRQPCWDGSPWEGLGEEGSCGPFIWGFLGHQWVRLPHIGLPWRQSGGFESLAFPSAPCWDWGTHYISLSTQANKAFLCPFKDPHTRHKTGDETHMKRSLIIHGNICYVTKRDLLDQESSVLVPLLPLTSW